MKRTPAQRADVRSADVRSADVRSADVRSNGRRSGGARRDRTDDLLLAKQALSQLSYGPVRSQ